MTQDWHVVYDLCPHGGSEIVIAQCLPARRLVAFCPMCNAAWLSPADLSESVDNYVICSDYIETGIAVPSASDVADSDWSSRVLRLLSPADYIPIDDINESLLAERAKRSA